MSRIILQLSGGLGNQMFQYALFLRLKALHRDAAIDDFTEYALREEDSDSRYVQRKPMLEKAFGITYPKASRDDLIKLTDGDLHLTSRIRRKLTGRHSLEKREEEMAFDPSFLTEETGYFTGCFQSAKYFDAVETNVRRAFTFRKERVESSKETVLSAEKIHSGSPSCAIHLRFGDYVAKADVYGGITTPAYYAAAIAYVRSHVPGVHFFVFSNDEKKAGDFIRQQEKQEDFTLLTGNDEENGDLDLYLMQLCDHFIIANSSFSWWGAYLGKARDKIVLAPSLWIHRRNGRDLSARDIYTKDMILVSPRGEIVTGKERKEPLVSVIVACCNVESYVRRAMDSCLLQTYENLEILAVDDGSTDDTGKILDAYAKKDSRVRVIHKENGGLSDARNAGLQVAGGQFVAYLDGDDFYDPCMIEYLVKAIQKTGADIATVRYREVKEDTPLPKKQESGLVDDALSASVLLGREKALDNFVSMSLTGNAALVIIYNSVWSKLFRREAVEGLTFQKGHNSEDILYTTRALLSAESVAVGTKPFYNYVTNRSGSIMNEKAGERRFRDEFPFFEEQIALLQASGYPEISLKAEYYFYRRLLFYDLDFRRSAGCKAYAKRLEEKMQAKKERILAVMEQAPCATKGDLARMRLFLKSPKALDDLDALYTKTIVKAKHGRD